LGVGVKEHGLLFRAAMVRALLRGGKDQTRRPIAPHNTRVWDEVGQAWVNPRKVWPDLLWETAVPLAERGTVIVRADTTLMLLFPRIRQGDRIWARETWWQLRGEDTVCFRADLSHEALADEATATRDYGRALNPWRSPIHLPRRHARVVLDVTAQTFAQRIGDLTPEQVLAEGFPLPESDPEGPASFREYWERLHGAWTPELLVWCYPGLRGVT
jgi:hypothetical protein